MREHSHSQVIEIEICDGYIVRVIDTVIIP